MATHLNSAAARTNPALQPLSILIGEWSTTGTHPYLPGVTLHGKATFEWLEGGAFVIMHSTIDHEEFPDGISIFGSDAPGDEYTVLYFDERTVSRKYTATLQNNVLQWQRTDPEFSQRFTGTISPDGNTITGKGEMAQHGAPWEADLSLTYTRVK